MIVVVGLLGLTCVHAQVRYPCGELGTTEVKILNHATSCSKYVICIGGQATIRDCAPGLRFDVQEGTCKVGANCTVEDLECPLYDDPNELVFHPNAYTCEDFTMCANGQQIEGRCSEGLHWDRVKQWCTFPEEAGCPVSIEILKIIQSFSCQIIPFCFVSESSDLSRARRSLSATSLALRMVLCVH